MSGAPTITTEIRPLKGWASLDLRELWEYRELLFFMTFREIKGRYRQMALGPMWVVIKPFLTMVVMSLVFGKLAKLPSDGLPYPLFAFAALLPWQLFSVSVSKSATSLVANMSVISKVYFPRLTIPLSAALTGLVDFCMSLVVLAGMMAWYGVVPTWNILYLPAFLLLAVLTALGVGTCLATVAVRFRDVGYAVDHVLQIAMYLTPVVYPTSLVPEQWRFLYQLNPMVAAIDGCRWALLNTRQAPELASALAGLITLALLLFGVYYFRRTERTIVDLL